MKEKYSLVIALLIFMPGCDSGVDMEEMVADNMVSVTSVISPQDTLLVAYLYKVQPLGQKAFEDSALLTEAQVIITDGNIGDTLLYKATSKRYEAERKYLDIVASGEYFLSIKTREGSTIQASCRIPPTPEDPKISGRYQENDYFFEVEWQNSSNHKYYTLTTFGYGFYELNNIDWQISPRLLDGQSYPSDEQFEKNRVTGVVPWAKTADHPELLIILRNIDESLFNYLDAYRDYSDWAANNQGNLFPNFQDFRPIYSNIENGVGVFAGCNQVTKKNPL